ncbi:MAG TPA: hypothetical protein VGJ05_04040 [Fimbriiglobus sp.]
MARYMIGSELREKLFAIGEGETVELTDEAGVVVGRFTPVYDPTRYQIVGEWASDEERRRRVREGKRYTAEEVEARLRGLNK